MKKPAKKSEWALKNEAFMAEIAQDPEAKALFGGTYYKILATGSGQDCPKLFSVVTCHYKGSLINGKVFDNSYERGCPEAFRCKDLIAGFTQALVKMHVGDKWQVFIPSDQGYGPKNDGPIPGGSTLIFEIELMGIA